MTPSSPNPAYRVLDVTRRARKGVGQEDGRAPHDVGEMLSPHAERQSDQFGAVAGKDIERVVDEHEGARRAAVLQRLEGRLAIRVERDDLAIEDRVAGAQRPRSRHDRRIRTRQVGVSAGFESDALTMLVEQGAIAIPLHLIGPLGSNGKFVAGEREHRSDPPVHAGACFTG